jgi:GT2 family glycosyltransferase
MREAMRRGVEYLLLLNNDTTVAPDFLHEMVAAIEADNKVAVVCPKIYFADRPGVLWYAGGDLNLWTGRCRHRGWREPDRGQFDGYRKMTVATGCAMLLRASVLSEVGLLDERFWAYLEDVEWSVRFLEKGYKLAFAPKAQVWHQWGATSVRHLGSGSQSKSQYLSTRNLLFLGRKHARWWQLPTFMLGFLIYEVGFYTLLRFVRRDFRALWAVYRGIGAAAKSIFFDPSWSGRGPEPSSENTLLGPGS